MCSRGHGHRLVLWSRAPLGHAPPAHRPPDVLPLPAVAEHDGGPVLLRTRCGSCGGRARRRPTTGGNAAAGSGPSRRAFPAPARTTACCCNWTLRCDRPQPAAVELWWLRKAGTRIRCRSGGLGATGCSHGTETGWCGNRTAVRGWGARGGAGSAAAVGIGRGRVSEAAGPDRDLVEAEAERQPGCGIAVTVQAQRVRVGAGQRQQRARLVVGCGAVGVVGGTAEALWLKAWGTQGIEKKRRDWKETQGWKRNIWGWNETQGSKRNAGVGKKNRGWKET